VYATTSASLSSTSKTLGSKLSAASESVGGKWGRLLRLTATRTSDAASSIALIERQSRHLLHHLMLILMEEICWWASVCMYWPICWDELAAVVAVS
jgi:hypothetical protein